MAYTANDFQRLVVQFAHSAEGKKFLKQQNYETAYTEREMRNIAEDLRSDIISVFLDIVDDPYAGASFNMNSIYVKAFKLQDGRVRMRILFHKEALSRPSLTPGIDEPARIGGVYDIIGLFTQGYTARDYAYGRWMVWDGNTPGNRADDVELEGDNYTEKHGFYTRSRIHLDPNPFINILLRKYQLKYPDIEFQWPIRWGGTMPDGD